jgi:microcystin-dependent protein
MVTLTHPFVSGKADGTDVTLVKPSNWNAEHRFETAADNVLLGRSAGTGPGPVQEVPFTSVFPAGMIMPFAGTNAPNGWLLCHGQSLVRVDYPALFAVIGTTYGAADAAHFSVPDLRGRVPAGVDEGTGRLPSWVLGSASNAPTSSTGVFSMAGTNNINFGSPGFIFTGGSGVVANNTVSGLAFGGGGVATQLNDPVTVQSITGYTNINGNFGISVSGASAAFSIVQPTIAINYLIKI